MKTLTNGMLLKVAGVVWCDKISFHIDRYADWPEDHKAIRSLEKYNEIEGVTNGVSIFAIKSGYSITDNYPGKAEQTAKDKLAFEAATMLENGEVIEADGSLYTVKIMGLQYSDPIHFIPA